MTTETILTKDDKLRIMENNILPRIPQILAAMNEVEQAVLQSEQVQALKRDAERYRWLRGTPDAEVRIFIDQPYGGREMSDHFLDDAIDAAMEQKT